MFNASCLFFTLAFDNGLRSEGICEIEIKDGYIVDL